MNLKKNNNQKGGLLRTILIIIGIILLLSFFGINIQSVVESDATQENVGYVTGEATTIWEQYLEAPLTWFWESVFVGLLWSAFVENMERIRDGEPTVLYESAPQVEVVDP